MEALGGTHIARQTSNKIKKIKIKAVSVEALGGTHIARQTSNKKNKTGCQCAAKQTSNNIKKKDK